LVIIYLMKVRNHFFSSHRR